MEKFIAGLALLFVSMQAVSAHGQSSKYPPLNEYMMTPEAGTTLNGSYSLPGVESVWRGM
jgi:hypothetical protein